jgi:hypothetical protein
MSPVLQKLASHLHRAGSLVALTDDDLGALAQLVDLGPFE